MNTPMRAMTKVGVSEAPELKKFSPRRGRAVLAVICSFIHSCVRVCVFRLFVSRR